MDRRMELLQVTGSQGKYECTCGNSHATTVRGMKDNDIRNVLLLLENKKWMVTLIEKIDSLLLSMGNSPELSSIINNFKMDTCIIMKAKSFFNILDGFKQLVNSTSFQMDKTKICVIPYSFHAQDLEVSPHTKVKVNLGENSSVLVIRATTNFVVPPFQLVKKYMRLHLKFDSTISFEGQVNDYLYTTSLYQVTSAYSFYDLIVLNTSENLITVDTSMILATINFQSPKPTHYTDQLLFMSTDMHSLLAYASTNEEILNQLNKSMYMQSVEMYMDKLCNPPKSQDPSIIGSLVTTYLNNSNLPSSNNLSLFVNRIDHNGKLHKKSKIPLLQKSNAPDAVDITAAQKSFLNKCLLQQMHWSHLQQVSDRFLATSQSEDETYRKKIEEILAGRKVTNFEIHNK